MNGLRRTLLLFTIIIIEGYVVLATELLAIRETVPYVGSGTDTVSIIIAAVLMPLAFGYYNGGHYRGGSVRARLVRNIVISLVILAFGLSYVTMNRFFEALVDLGVRHRLMQASLYAAVFLVTPVYLLGQTVPLVSNYFPRQKLSRITGRILFFSTLGSFTGATFSTLVLMSFVGVHWTVAITLCLLASLVPLLSRKKASEPVIIALGVAGFALWLNSGAVMRDMHVVSNNQYNTIIALEKDGDRHMLLNLSSSSMYNDKGHKYPYIEFLEKRLIDPIRKGDTPKEILVVGAGAFTFGLEDMLNHYDYVDIDPSLKDAAEKHILKKPVPKNKVFTPVEARAFLMGTDKKYDLILLDVYLGSVTLPEHLVTQEFYRQVRGHLKPGGLFSINLVISASFGSALSRHMDDTIRSVFPYVTRESVQDYNPWSLTSERMQNVIYISRNDPDTPPEVYTDDKNRLFFDKPQRH